MRDKQEENFNKHHRAKSFDKLMTGVKLWIKDVGTGVVQASADTPRSYIVNTGTGLLRKHLSHMADNQSDEQNGETDQSDTHDESVDKPTEIRVSQRERKKPSYLRDYETP